MSPPEPPPTSPPAASAPPPPSSAPSPELQTWLPASATAPPHVTGPIYNVFPGCTLLLVGMLIVANAIGVLTPALVALASARSAWALRSALLGAGLSAVGIFVLMTSVSLFSRRWHRPAAICFVLLPVCFIFGFLMREMGISLLIGLWGGVCLLLVAADQRKCAPAPQAFARPVGSMAHHADGAIPAVSGAVGRRHSFALMCTRLGGGAAIYFGLLAFGVGVSHKMTEQKIAVFFFGLLGLIVGVLLLKAASNRY